MIRLIASDIDGTLLLHGTEEDDRHIPDAFFREANRLMDAGIAVCAASGRQYASLRELFAPAADRMYFLCENGAAVFGPGDPGQLLSKTVIDRALSLELVHDILKHPDCEVLISGTNTSYVCPKSGEYVDMLRYFTGNNITQLEQPEDMPEDFIKISAYCEKGAQTIAGDFLPKWGEVLNCAIAGFGWLDFTLADKGTGIRALCAHLGIEPSQVMAFGDNWNDVPMLDTVGHPRIMAHADNALLERYPVKCRRVPESLNLLPGKE